MAQLSAPSYDHWYGYDELVAWLRQAADAFPGLCALRSIGKTPEGRDIWLAEVTDTATGSAEDRPVFFVHANIHAKELAGTTASLQLIHDLLSGEGGGIDVHALLRDVVFAIIPRLNPDGAEFALTTGGEIRSRLEEQRIPNGLYQHDVDGDGAIVSMRIERPDGDMKISEADARLMVPRDPTDTDGPFYRVYPEGLIHEYDGGDFTYRTRSHDFNRNWPANWRQEHEQGGAGDYPFSEPEMRALADYVYSHPGIFGVLGFHCGTNAILTPPSVGAETDVTPQDRDVFRRLNERAAELTGFDPRATIDYRHDSQPPIALQGHSADWGYQHMGLFHYEIELGNIYNAAGVSGKDFFAAEPWERYEFERDAIRYHDEHPDYGIFVDWHDFEHPQLGTVQIGGWRRFWLINPSLEQLRERIAPGSSRFIIEYAARRPRLAVTDTTVKAVAGEVYRVRAHILNAGAFATNITQRALALRSLKPVVVELLPAEGVEVLSRSRHHEIAQLPAHGRSHELEWFVRGPSGSQVTIRASAPKSCPGETVVTLP